MSLQDVIAELQYVAAQNPMSLQDVIAGNNVISDVIARCPTSKRCPIGRCKISDTILHTISNLQFRTFFNFGPKLHPLEIQHINRTDC